ncbi:hypothetical protein HMPREF0198_2123 [Cardiobacterium hominis ATCC 15826]|uniref:Uncharacterized protein n=1 Tax=Cardiobacterium hominis (strain ATCC 15826 / DSM 8339 / NCTC 10426 / 6573) TaxID=638300 RepID=C8NC95_CARH6|nr:hypothetical protein HMPREF0198_2123 [Cardiobacterium hominis ATCC 15826]
MTVFSSPLRLTTAVCGIDRFQLGHAAFQAVVQVMQQHGGVVRRKIVGGIKQGGDVVVGAAEMIKVAVVVDNVEKTGGRGAHVGLLLFSGSRQEGGGSQLP